MLAAGPPAVRPPPFLRPISDDDDDSQGSFNIDEIDRPIVPLVISIPTVRGPPLDSRGGGGQEYLSRANYLFQPGSAAL